MKSQGSSSTEALVRFLMQQRIIHDHSAIPPFEILGNTPIRTLAQRALIDEKAAYKALSERFKLRFEQNVQRSAQAQLLIERTPLVDTCIKNVCIPLDEQDGVLTVGISNPFNQDGVKALEFATGKRCVLVIIPEEEIRKTLTGESPLEPPRDQLTLPLEQVHTSSPISAARELDEALDPAAPPIIRLVDRILLEGVQKRASDIHIEPTETELTVRMRIDGAMREVTKIPRTMQAHVLARIKLTSGMDIAEKRRPQDGRAQIKLHGDEVDIRVSSMPTAYGEKLVLRLLRADPSMLSMAALNLPNAIQSRLTQALTAKSGLVLVTGPTGSGKTTTLYACLNELKTGSTNIVTIEDPIEYRMRGINQIQVHDDIGVTFPTILRSVLRQDPDIILLGEIRDKETATIALQAAQTGHLVLSTLHTNDAPGALSRLLDMGVDPLTCGSSIKGIMAQRLVRKLCTSCASHPSDQEWQELVKDQRVANSLAQQEVKVPRGCAHCDATGYRGRTALYSYLEITKELRALIAGRAPEREIVAEALRNGYQELSQVARNAAREGITSLQEALPYLTSEPLPATAQRSVLSLVEKQEPERVRGTDEHQERHILIVDDNDDIRMVLSALLKRHQFVVTAVESGREALQYLAEQRTDLVLLDLKMPKMNGLEVLAAIKGEHERTPMPVIVLTASDSEEREIELLQAGASDFISKASSPDKIVMRIKNSLREVR
jgi:type II secretory ATPase GspE/PulE/Tfp pilus assembly ATPase PilB-like protein/ActR/RegA family two-component response regulator